MFNLHILVRFLTTPHGRKKSAVSNLGRLENNTKKGVLEAPISPLFHFLLTQKGQASTSVMHQTARVSIWTVTHQLIEASFPLYTCVCEIMRQEKGHRRLNKKLLQFTKQIVSASQMLLDGPLHNHMDRSISESVYIGITLCTYAVTA